MRGFRLPWRQGLLPFSTFSSPLRSMGKRVSVGWIHRDPRSCISPALTSAISSPYSTTTDGTTTTTSDSQSLESNAHTSEIINILKESTSPLDGIKKKRKFRAPRKQAAKIMTEIIEEHKKRYDIVLPNIRPGDAVSVQILRFFPKEGEEEEIFTVNGIIIGIYKKHLDSSALIRVVTDGYPWEIRIKLYSPLIKSIRILKRHAVKPTGKKVRRAKLYYLRDKLTALCEVTSKDYDI